MELELRLVERQGGTRQGARPGGRRAPTLVDRVWAPLRESWIRGSSDNRTIYFGRTVGL